MEPLAKSNTFSLLLLLTLIPGGAGHASVIVDTTLAANFVFNDPTSGDQITILNGPIANGFQTICTAFLETAKDFDSDCSPEVVS